VPSKKTLNSTNLEALGAQRLAELLIEVSTGNAAVKQRLRLELAGAHNPGEVAKEVRKRLTTIARSRTFIDFGMVRVVGIGDGFEYCVESRNAAAILRASSGAMRRRHRFSVRLRTDASHARRRSRFRWCGFPRGDERR
jgi:hypothetical protein